MSNKAWGGRFETQPEEWVDDFDVPVDFDKSLAKQGVQGSTAHTTMLAKRHTITDNEVQSIVNELKNTQSGFEKGKPGFKASLGDIHLNIKHELIQCIGEAGGRPYTGRNRNDQTATNMHLYTKEQTQYTTELVASFQETIVRLIDQHVDTIMSGYTYS